MKKVSMAVSIKHIDGQPNEFRVDFHAEAELPDDATLEKLKDQMNDFKHLAKHCTDKVGDNNQLPQSIPNKEPMPSIPASPIASASSDEPVSFKVSNTTPPAESNPNPNPYPVPEMISNRAPAPRPKPQTNNQNNKQDNPATPSQVNMLYKIIERKGLREVDILKEYGVSNLTKMTHGQVAEFKKRYDP